MPSYALPSNTAAITINATKRNLLKHAVGTTIAIHYCFS
jgi:hypothetical protein